MHLTRIATKRSARYSISMSPYMLLSKADVVAAELVAAAVVNCPVTGYEDRSALERSFFTLGY
jgi:hypothetical protein